MKQQHCKDLMSKITLKSSNGKALLIFQTSLTIAQRINVLAAYVVVYDLMKTYLIKEKRLRKSAS